MNKISKILYLAVFLSPLFAISSVEALPPGVPTQMCTTIARPTVGTLCYKKVQGGVKANAGDKNRKDYRSVAQPLDGQHVLVDTIIEIKSQAGTSAKPEVHEVAAGGSVTIANESGSKLRELQQVRSSMEAKVAAMIGVAKVQAQQKLDVLLEEERNYSTLVSTVISTSAKATSSTVTAWAERRKCGTLLLDWCGSWVEFDIYRVYRYIGDPIAEYNRPWAIALDTQKYINNIPAPTPKWAIVAKSNSTNNIGYSFQLEDQQQSRDRAVSTCSAPDCVLVTEIKDGYVAVGNDAGVAWGYSAQEAKDKVVAQCRANNPGLNCVVYSLIGAQEGRMQ
jgi:Domain of unknown function (DUF4189)